jgi:hypothetical protein
MGIDRGEGFRKKARRPDIRYHRVTDHEPVLYRAGRGERAAFGVLIVRGGAAGLRQNNPASEASPTGRPRT